MKTKQFIKGIKAMGFDVKELHYNLAIYDENEFSLAHVSKKEVGVLVTDFPCFYRLDYFTKMTLLYLLNEYAKTPVEDREEEEKYYYKLKGLNGPWNFLVKFKDGEPLSIGTYAVAKDREGTFTDKEFAALPDDIKSHNWEKIKVERDNQ